MGKLDEVSVFNTIIRYLSVSLNKNKNALKLFSFLKSDDYPREIYIILPRSSKIDSQEVIHVFQEPYLYEGLWDTVDVPRKLSLMDTVRLFRLYTDEIKIIEDRIEKFRKFHNEPPTILMERKIKIERDLKQIASLLSSSNMIIMGDQVMGDQYNVGQAGAVGPNSSAQNNNFNQIWQEIEGTTNLRSLADELSSLRLAMKKEAVEPEHDAAVGSIAIAEQEARKGNGAKVVESLRIAGKWALSIAEKIGVGLAVAAMKTALGI